MARIELAPGVDDDIERILDHLLRHESPNAGLRVAALIEAIDILKNHPLIGRPGRGEMRELVIGTRHRGYLALYVYLAEVDTVLVLALRSQREAGYCR